MGEEQSITFAQVVEAWREAQVFSAQSVCFGVNDAVLGALAMAGKEPFALLALLGQAVRLHRGKALLLGAVHQLVERVLVDVAQLVLGEDEVVAAVDVAVPLHHAGMPASFGHRADSGQHADPVGQGGIEELDEHRAHIPPYPLVEDGTEEVAPLGGGD